MQLSEEEKLQIEFENNMADPYWRCCNLYSVVNKDGNNVPFRPSKQQRVILDDVYRKGHKRLIILKARQLGFSTLIEIMMLDCALFNNLQQLCIIADTDGNAKKLMHNKVKFGYNNLPSEIRSAVHVQRDNENMIEFDNESVIFAGTRARGGTHQFMHISELGKICNTDAGRAREIKSGAFPSVPKDGIIIIESTFEGGKFGLFYDLINEAMSKPEDEFTEMDFRFRFFPWWEEDQYVLNGNAKIVKKEDAEYFEELSSVHKIELSLEQKIWYVVEKKKQKEDMLREYPSTAEEAIEVPIKGAYYAKSIARAKVERRVTNVDYDKMLPCFCFWDVGVSDSTVIWWVQFQLNRLYWIDCYSNTDEDPDFYADIVHNKPYRVHTHFLPHDAGYRGRQTTKTYEDLLRSAGLRNTRCLPKTNDINVGINYLRGLLDRSWFDVTRCESGVSALGAYHRKWVEDKGIYKEKPEHDESSHFADAARYCAEAVMEGFVEKAVNRFLYPDEFKKQRKALTGFM